MPKVNQQPDPNRRQTRSTNANTHPGRIVIEAIRVRRSKEAIEDDKRARDEKRQAREAKKANKQAAVTEIAEFENQMALDNRDEEIKFPRYKKGVQSNRLTSHRVKSLPVAEDSQPSKKRKGQPKVPKVSNDHSQKTVGSVQITSEDNEGDTDIELTDDDRLQAKKIKTLSGPQAIRRTG
jgi:hypothetical protein